MYGNSVSVAEVQSYVDYRSRFYSANHGTAIHCTQHRLTSECRALWQSALSRLIEERVILHFSAGHHIDLSASDQARVRSELSKLTSPTAFGPAAAYRGAGVGKSFLSAVLSRELLVRQVENAVAPSSTKKGKSVEIDRLTIPATSGGYQAALTLATQGSPVPTDATIRREWVAIFRITGDLRRALDAATPGQYIGPFSKPSAYLVVHLLKKSVHAYGSPARTALETSFFRMWLAHQLAAAHPQCFDATGKTARCPTT